MGITEPNSEPNSESNPNPITDPNSEPDNSEPNSEPNPNPNSEPNPNNQSPIAAIFFVFFFQQYPHLRWNWSRRPGCNSCTCHLQEEGRDTTTQRSSGRRRQRPSPGRLGYQPSL